MKVYFLKVSHRFQILEFIGFLLLPMCTLTCFPIAPHFVMYVLPNVVFLEPISMDQYKDFLCRNPSFGLATKAKGVARLWAKREETWESRQRHCKGASQEEAGESHHILPGVWEVWGSEHSHSQSNSHFGRWSPDGVPKLQRAIVGVKTQWIVTFFISLESYWNLDV